MDFPKTFVGVQKYLLIQAQKVQTGNFILRLPYGMSLAKKHEKKLPFKNIVALLVIL